LEPTKDAAGSYDRTVTWTLEKSVSPASHSGYAGDTFDSTWTVVADKTEVSDNYKVTGSISIYNPAAIPQTFSVSDVLDDGTEASVTCDIYTIPAGGTASCTYTALPAGGEATLNTATVSAAGNPDQTATADVSFTENLIGYDSGILADERFDFEQEISGDTTVTFDETFECSTDPADYGTTGSYSFFEINEATLNGNIDLSDDARVDVECMGYEQLTVSKTAATSFTRTHDWSIDKTVETEFGYEHDGLPKIWLYVDGAGDETATWTVDVSYEGFEDSDFEVFGQIEIENSGTLDAVITSVDDLLFDTTIHVTCEVAFPYPLPVGDTLTCSYDEDLEGKIEGKNTVNVTTEVRTYSADADVTWGDPASEVDASVTIKDVSDLLGEVELGTVTAPNSGQFTYDKRFAWADYGADGGGDYIYDNTASIVETGEYAAAALKVNVQRYLYETAFAKGEAAECFLDHGFKRWGWTNPILPGAYTWDLWAGAAQCDTNNGVLVGSVTVEYLLDEADGNYYVTVTYNVESPYLLDETHVYAGYDMFPQELRGKRSVDTVAPGQYYNAGPFDGSEIYVIAHAVVGIPDPDFGP
jgi:hypothetical protein